MRIRQKVFMCFLWFCFGFVTQKCAVELSMSLKVKDGLSCERATQKIDNIIECFDYKQSAMSRVFINSLNPSAELFDKWFIDLLMILESFPSEGGKSDHGVDRDI